MKYSINPNSGNKEKSYPEKYNYAGQPLKSSKARSKALNKKKDAIDIKYDKLNASKGLTPSGKRKWHFYNTKI